MALELEREAKAEDVLDAVRTSEFEDASVREVAEAFPEEKYETVRSWVRDLRKEDRLVVTRQVGPAKLYKVAEDGET